MRGARRGDGPVHPPEGGEAPEEDDGDREVAQSSTRKRPVRQDAAVAAGPARPSLPISAYAEDFTLLLRIPRRLRLVRGRIRVLS